LDKSITLITGGAGFIGSHLVEGLLARGHKVRVFDNFSTGQRANLGSALGKIELIRGDVRNLGALGKAMRGVSLVYHLAAVSSVPQSVDDPLTTADVNVGGSWNLFEAARLAKVRRVVFISSASVYGASAAVPFRESARLRGSSPYAASKLIGEQLCGLYWDLYGIETVAMRLFSVFGPRQNPRSQYANVIPAFATCVLSGKRPTINGDGRQTRDFIYVGDVVRALLAAGSRRGAVNEVINFGSGHQTSIRNLLSSIQAALQTDLKPVFAPKKPGDDPRTCAYTGKYRKILGISRLTPFASGLDRTLSWFRALDRGQR
jgi:UDP-glucose 4-epimerase